MPEVVIIDHEAAVLAALRYAFPGMYFLLNIQRALMKEIGVWIFTCYFHVLQGYLQRNYLKRYQSTDCFLKLENIKEESLVIVYQHDTVNMCLWLVHTARHA